MGSDQDGTPASPDMHANQSCKENIADDIQYMKLTGARSLGLQLEAVAVAGEPLAVRQSPPNRC